MKNPPVKIHDAAMKAGLYRKVEAHMRQAAAQAPSLPIAYTIGWARGWNETLTIDAPLVEGAIDAEALVANALSQLDALYSRWPGAKCEGESEERTGNVLVSHDLLLRAERAMRGTRAAAVAEELGAALAGKGKR